MPGTVDAKTTTLKLRLLRVGQTFTVEGALKEGHRLQEVSWRGIDNARLFVGSVYTNPPPWASFLNGQAEQLPDLFNSGCAAVLFVPVDGRTIAVCFGHAHMVMNTHHFESNFGLKVTLNKVERGKLRSIDAATPDATTFQKRVQASRNSDLALFGIDYDRDLLTLAAGTPDDTGFAKFLAGRDSLSITTVLTPTGIQNKCRQALAAFNATDYRTHYKWVDHIQAVREDDTVRELDNLLFGALQELRAGGQNDLHLAPPEIVDYTDGNELRFNGLGERGQVFSQLAIEDYVAELERINFAGDIAAIKGGHRVSAKCPESDTFSEKWNIYNCFIYETDHQGSKFALFAGQWYRVDRDFSSDIEDFFASLPRVEIVRQTNRKTEEELIADLEAGRQDLLKLDRELISAAGLSRDRIEACDFFSTNKQFIHLKDGHSSSPISHLWMQGVVSAEAFASSPEFRKKLRKKVNRLKPAMRGHLPTDRQHRFDRSAYSVVYGVMRKRNRSGVLDLPFFSKVSLRSAVQRLQTLGYSVAINLIEKQ